jgi:UDP-glucuronate 4-epimerase
MNILITGVAGFIGFSLAEKLLIKKNNIFGIDNFDDYYSVNLKKKRVQILKRKKNFLFSNIDFTNQRKIDEYFKKKKFDCVIHLGAQAGVRYSLINPSKYFNTNIIGFSNIINNCVKQKIKKVFYASSSSVYGDLKLFPLKENLKLFPKNIYSKSKQINEQIASDVSKSFNINMVGLRFFTVYGPWGRPDMFLMKFLNSIFNKKNFYLFNKGNHTRDFTYIDDIVDIMISLVKKDLKGHHIFNICSNKPIHLSQIIKCINKYSKKLPKIVRKKFQKADVLKTHGDNKKIKKIVNFKNFTPIDIGVKKTIEWYTKNKIWKY